MTTPPHSPDDRDDEDLLAAARRGDDAAFARLLERHDPVLRRMVGVLVDHRDTEAVLREGYVKAYRALGRAHGVPVVWLGRACYLTALDEVRRRDRRRSGGPGRKPSAEPPPGPAGRLPPDQRAVLVLDGLVAPEVVASILATTPSTVERLRARAGDGAVAVLEADEEPPSGAFWRELGTRLLAERDAPPVPPPRIERPGPSPDPAATADPPVAMQRRPPAAVRRATGADPVEGLARGARHRRVRRRVDARVIVSAAVIVILAVVLLVVIRMASNAASPVRENSVAQISGKVAQVLDGGMTASFVRTVPGTDGPERVEYESSRDASGSYVIRRKDGAREAAYDAAAGTRVERSVGLDGSVSVTEGSGLAAGPPDPSGYDASLPDAELATALRGLLSVTGREAESSTAAGRAVWRLDGPLESTGAGQPDHALLVVDKARLAPLVVRLTDGGHVVRQVRFTAVDLSDPTGPPRIDTKGVTPQPVDHGFRPTNLSEATASVGDRPIRPTYLPPGFELVDTTLDADDGVVSLRYQRGVQQVVVTTRPAAGVDPNADPFERAEPVGPDDVQVERGPFRDVGAHRTMTVAPPPALWGQSGSVAFTICGDLTGDQLVRVAESMR